MSQRKPSFTDILTASRGYGRGSKNPQAWNGLVGLWSMGEGGGDTVRDIAGGNDGVINGATWETGPNGSVLQFLGLSQDDSVTFLPITLSTYTLAIRFLVTDLTEDIRVLFGSPSSVDNFLKLTVAGQIHHKAGGELESVVHAVSLNEWHQLVVTKQGVNLAWWFDGKQIGVDTFSSDVSFTTDRIGIANIDDEFDGLVDFAAIWNRPSSPSEIQDLYQDPYRLITPRTRHAIAAPPVAAAGNPWYYYAQQTAVTG